MFVADIDRDEDYCEPEPCLNGGTCRKEGEGYRCQCLSLYKGNQCEEGETCFVLSSSNKDCWQCFISTLFSAFSFLAYWSGQ